MAGALLQLAGRTLVDLRHDPECEMWVFTFSAGVVLQAWAPWRVRRDGQVAAGWRDHGYRFGHPAAVDLPARVRGLAGASVVGRALHDNGGDLVLAFGSGVLLEVFADSSGHEAWIVNGPGTRRVVCQGGGSVVDTS